MLTSRRSPCSGTRPVSTASATSCETKRPKVSRISSRSSRPSTISLNDFAMNPSSSWRSMRERYCRLPRRTSRMPATSPCSGAMMPPASPHADQQCAEQTGCADDDDPLPQTRAAAPSASSYDRCIRAKSGCGSCDSTGTISDWNRSSSAVNGDVVRVRVLSNADRASGGGMTRPRRSFGHEDANTRSCGQERNVGARRTLEPSPRNGRRRLRRAAGSRSRPARTPARRPAGTAAPSSFGDPRRRLLRLDRLAQRRELLDLVPGAILLRRRHEHRAELVGDPEQIDADALLPALRGRRQCLGLVGREIEMRSDRALQREVARQQDGVRLAAARRAP